MKYLLLVLLPFLLLSVVATSYAQFQNPPVPFMQEILHQFLNVRDVSISPTRNEVYFTAQSVQGELSAIFHTKLYDNKWSTPEIASFSGKYIDLEPSFSPDGLKLYFSSNRPLDSANPNSIKDYDIWYVERTAIFAVWSAPINLGAPINSKDDEFFPSISKYKTMFFTSDRPGTKGKDDIFFSKYNNGKYDVPQIVNDSVNSPGYEFNAFISPDETFLVYTCYNHPGGLGSGDLCISFNKGDNLWTAPFFLGKEVNSAQMDYCPFVDIENGILYFTSKRSARINLPNKPFTTQQFMQEINRYDNGLSRLYMVDIKDWIRDVVK